MSALPRVLVIATGGTIAGLAPSPGEPGVYAAGVVDAPALLAAVPALGELAELRAEQLFALDSSDLGPAHWIALACRVRLALSDPELDAVVVTHGTDTLEESAYFLQLSVDTVKPVVMTAAMRPANALSADGPANLYDAVSIATAPGSAAHGVLVTLGGAIFHAVGLRKLHTRRLDAFAGDRRGPAGTTSGPEFFRPPPAQRALVDPAALTELPMVEILHVAAGSPPALLEAALQAGARGLVLALPGNGTVPQAWRRPIARATAAGIPVMRASRCGSGAVGRHPDDAALGTLAVGDLPASQARVALMLALARQQPALLRQLLAAP